MESTGNIRVSPERIRKFAKENAVSLAEISRRMGHSDGYMSKVCYTGVIPKRKLDLLCALYKADPIELVEIAGTVTPSDCQCDTPYSVNLLVKPDRVRVQICHCSEVLYSAWSNVKGENELNLIQAISYAAHMCYKLAEQKTLQNET